MNWKLKAHVLAALSRSPGGNRLYHLLQRSMKTNALDIDEYLSRAFEVIELAREAGNDPKRGAWLEIGTGWWPVVPLLLYLKGADRIITFDINPWLSGRQACETFVRLGEKLDVIARRLEVDLDPLAKRYQAAIPYAKSLENLLSACQIEYRCPADARFTGLPEDSVDVVCSSNVLEHIPMDVLRGIHKESIRILRPGGLAVHRFNPADHYSFSDGSITAVNFLQYDPNRWYWYGGSGLAFHNRLRCVQHRELVQEAGFSIGIDRVRLNERAYHALKCEKLRVHPEFQRFTPEELAAEYMWLVGVKTEVV